MRTWAKGTARAAVLTAGFVALGANTVFPGDAYADTTSGASSVLGGNQINLPVSVPINISGNAVAVAGNSNAGSKGGASVVNQGGSGGEQETSGKNSVVGGNQVNAPVSAPINACGNAIAIFGTADAGCKGGATVDNSGSSDGQETSGRGSVVGGNQVNAPVSAPINACGNAIAIFGNADAGCKGGASVRNSGSGGAGRTRGSHSVGGGNQVSAPVSTPVNVCGNAAGLFGDAVAGCKGGASVKNTGGHDDGQRTSGRSSVLGGNQLNTGIAAPIDVCGNGHANCKGGASVHDFGGSGSNTTNGDSGVLAGNQVHAPIAAPVDVCGNAVALLGKASADCKGGASVRGSGSDGDTTSGRSGVAAGNQVFAPITAPVNVCGNAAAVLGDASAGCVGTATVGGEGNGGQHTTGGNQIDGPVKAPIDTCGNVATVGGQVDPSCGNGALVGGGRHEHDSAPGNTPVPLGLPAVPGLTRALPVTPGSALPTLPLLPGREPQAAPADGQVQLPVQAPQLPVGVPALPGGVQHFSAPAKPRKPKHGKGKGKTAKTAKTETSPTPAPSAPTKHQPRKRKTTPQAAMIESGPLTGLAGALPAGLPQLPVQTPASLPTGLPQLPGQAPTELLPKLPVGVDHQAAPVPAPHLPALSELPVAAAAPVGGHLNTPQVGGVTDKLGNLGNLRPVASTATLAEGPTALYALTIGGLLAAASSIMAFGRRIRLGRK